MFSKKGPEAVPTQHKLRKNLKIRLASPLLAVAHCFLLRGGTPWKKVLIEKEFPDCNDGAWLSGFVLRSEPPFTGVSGPSRPKIGKKVSKGVLLGGQKKSPKIRQKVKKVRRKSPKIRQKVKKMTPKVPFSELFGPLFFLGLYGVFSGTLTFSGPPQRERPFFRLFCAILGPEGPETPVNGRSGRELCVEKQACANQLPRGALVCHYRSEALMKARWLRENGSIGKIPTPIKIKLALPPPPFQKTHDPPPPQNRVFRRYADGCYANWFFAPSRF